jgi:hypothetical protein
MHPLRTPPRRMRAASWSRCVTGMGNRPGHAPILSTPSAAVGPARRPATLLAAGRLPLCILLVGGARSTSRGLTCHADDVLRLRNL